MRIEVFIPNDGRETFIHCFRNFGEDVYRALRDSCEISIHEIDGSTDHFEIRQISENDISKVFKILKEIAEAHFFSETIQLTKKTS